MDKLEKEIKKIGTTNALELIAEKIEEITGCPCRVRHYSTCTYITLYDKRATKKQVRYNRLAIGEIGGFSYYGGEIMLQPLKDTIDPPVPLPHDISEVIKIISDREYEKQYRRSMGQVGKTWFDVK